MENIIPKELLRTVLKVDSEIHSIEIEEPNFVTYFYHFGRDICEDTINIYELAHKCKEWALTKGFEITQEFSNIRVISLDRSRYIQDFSGNNYDVRSIFKACQWILDNKDATNGRA